jgi:hypothetical protein
MQKLLAELAMRLPIFTLLIRAKGGHIDENGSSANELEVISR